MGRTAGFNWKKTDRDLGMMGKTEHHHSRKMGIHFLWEFLREIGIKTKGKIHVPSLFPQGKNSLFLLHFLPPQDSFPFGNRVHFPVKNTLLKQKEFPGLPAEAFEVHNRLGNKRSSFFQGNCLRRRAGNHPEHISMN